MDKAPVEQAWNEIHSTFLDDMLNLGQKKQFVIAILQGQLANPPPAKPQGEAREHRLIDGENWVRVESVCDTIKALEAHISSLQKEAARVPQQPTTRLLEAAKSVVMMWHIGSDDRLKDAVKSLNEAIEAQGGNNK